MWGLVSQSWISVGINWTRVWAPLGRFSSFPTWLFSDLCVFWQAIRVEQCRPAPAFLRGEAGPVYSNTGRKQRSLDSMKCRGTAETLRRTRKRPNKKYWLRGRERYLGQKITSLLWFYTEKGKHSYTIPSIIYMYCGRQSRGKGVGLQLLCAREEEWVPGDVILAARGQLSQYNGRGQKRSHRETENTKPSPAIFSLMWHGNYKSMKNSD